MWSRPTEGVGESLTRKPAERRALLLACLVVAAAACSLESGTYQGLPENAPRVVIETDLGAIVVGLYEERAPLTVANFLSYVDAGHYDGTVFHRVMPGFMIQGGGYVRDAGGRFRRSETRAPIALEADTGLRNLRGAVSMARLDWPDTARDEFFINLVDNQRLDRLGEVQLGYAVFGAVLEGMEVVDAIAAVETHLVPEFTEPTTPVRDVVIRSVRRLR